MLKKFFRWWAILPLLALLAVLPASSAMAADIRGEDTIIIASGDVIDDDLYLAAQKIVINGTVNGDVMCIGDTTVNGIINGSLTAVGSTMVIDGEITHAVRVAGGNIDIRGKVGKDVMVAGTSIDIQKTAQIGRDLVFATEKIRVDALIEDGIKGYGGTADLASQVNGNVDVQVTNLTIESTADIQGNLVYNSKNEVEIITGAHIGGTTTHNIPAATKQPVIPTAVKVWFRVVCFIMTLVTGGLIILLAPKRATAVAASIKRKPWLSLGWGALIFCATPIAALIVCITVIGIPVGIIGIMFYLIALYLSQVAVGLFLGYWILGFATKVNSRGMLLAAFALGFVILTLVSLIPYFGSLVCFAAALFGLGAMALSQKMLRTMEPARTVEITNI
jgi:hypothetical protein